MTALNPTTEKQAVAEMYGHLREWRSNRLKRVDHIIGQLTEALDEMSRGRNGLAAKRLQDIRSDLRDIRRSL